MQEFLLLVLYFTVLFLQTIEVREGCMCGLCPDNTTIRRNSTNGDPVCPCPCIDGTTRETNRDGSCPVSIVRSLYCRTHI